MLIFDKNDSELFWSNVCHPSPLIHHLFHCSHDDASSSAFWLQIKNEEELKESAVILWLEFWENFL